ncbi:hypothetical protein Rs2_23823 [Raphanus sativus]|nr:hypothetical protein Rs2_23823 [Raphanus sativus]
MDNKSATTAKADHALIEKKTSDVMQILQGFADRLQKIEEKMDCRLQKMEEKVDLLISSISAKAEADTMSIDQFSSGQESYERYTDDRFGRFPDGLDQERYDRFLFGPGRGQETYDGFGPVFDGRGRGQETYDRLGRFYNGGAQYSYDRFGRFNGRGRGLHVGGPFSGGRCGGQGQCGYC